MRLAFTTLGCPNWDLDTLCRLGPEYGYHGVDFRGLQDELDITILPAFTSQAAATKRQLDDAGLVVSAISSSLRICEADKLQRHLDEARRTIDVARDFDCQRIRVFGGGHLDQMSRDEAARIGVDTMQQVLDLPGAADLTWMLETHDHWTTSSDCRAILSGVNHPAFGLLWDIGHTTRVGDETPEQTWHAVGSHITYAHLKDAVHHPEHPNAMKDGWRYVPPGSGQLPIAEAVMLLHSNGFDGWLLFEHEKRWHPELPEPEDIFPAFVQWAHSLFG